MKNTTPIYQLGYFIPNLITGDNLDLDKNRFLTIENQLFNVYNIFGNGILERHDSNGAQLPSWLLSQVPNQQTIQISEGTGHINYKYAETLEPVNIDLILPPGATSGSFIYYFYATENLTTPWLKTVDFTFSLTQIQDPNVYIGLGAVSLVIGTDGKFSITIYNDAEHGRQEISLFASLASLVKNHVHTGGPNNPSPIDLAKHVTGFLSSDNIGELDLNKVTVGTLDPNRLPEINHGSLKNIGTLTHEQIDALLASIQYPGSNYKLSDYGIVNRLQIILALKSQSGFFNIDGEQLNTIFYMPYTQLSGFVDTTNTTATVNTDVHRVYGVTGIPRQSNSLKINTTQDFQTALFYAEDSVIYPSVDNIEVTGVNSSSAAGTLNLPYGLTGSANTIFISNYSDSYVSSFSTTGTYINRRINFDPNLNLNSPLGLWYDSSGNYLYIADTFNHRIVVTDGSLSTTIALVGKNNGSGLSGSNPGEFNFPKGVYGMGNTFYVSDSGNNRIQKFVWQSGVPVYQTSYQFSSYSNATISGVTQSLNDPRGLIASTIGGNSFLFVADYGNHRVLCGVETGGFFSVSNILGDNSAGIGISNPSLISYAPSSGSVGYGASFSFGTSVNGTISLITVTNPGNAHVNSDTYILSYPGLNQGIIYVSTNGAGGVSTAYVQYGVSTNSVYGFNHPQGLAFTSMNSKMNLLVTDTDNNRVLGYQALAYAGAGTTNNQFKYYYSFGTVGSASDTSSLIYFERPTGIYSQLGFTTVFVADSLNNRFHGLSTSFARTSVSGIAATTYGIGDTSLTSGGITLAKPFSYIGIANTFVLNQTPAGWYVGEVITQGTNVQADIVDRYNYYIFSQFNLIKQDTIAIALNTVNESFPNQSLGAISCYLIFADDFQGESKINFSLSTNPARNSINKSNNVLLRSQSSTQTTINSFVNIASFTDQPNPSVIGIGFKWSTNTGWANADFLNLGWFLPEFNSQILGTNYPKVLTYRQNNGLNQALFAFNANRFAQDAWFVFRFDSGSVSGATFDYAIFEFSLASSLKGQSSIDFYYRTSNTIDQLNSNQNFLQYSYDPSIGIVSGEALKISTDSTARYIDLLFNLSSAPDYLANPVISSIALYYSVFGQNLGVIYDTNVSHSALGQYPRLKWSQGKYSNISISPIPQSNTQSYQISIASTSNIGKYQYLSPSNMILSSADLNEQFLVDVNNSLYLSPFQTFTNAQPGLLNPQHYCSNNNGGFFIADTDNDRVIEIDANGELLRAIQGNIKLSRSDRDFVVLGCYYNTKVKQLYLVFSQYINLSDGYASKISILLNGNYYLLTDSVYFDQVNMGLFNINTNSASATFYVNVTPVMDDLFVNSVDGGTILIQNTATPPFVVPTSGRSDGYPLENDTITYNLNRFSEFDSNINLGVGTILNYSSSYVISVVDPTVFGGNTDSPSTDLLSYTLANVSPSYSNFYSIPIQNIEIYFENIFKPINVSYTSEGTLIVSTVGNNSIRAYDSNFAQKFSVGLTDFAFNEKLGGSAIILDTNPGQPENNLLIATPSIVGSATTIGLVSVFNRNLNTTINQYQYKDLYAVKATTVDNDFMILLYDKPSSGLRSKLIRIDQNGKNKYMVNNIFTKPVSLDIEENGNVYVTDTTGQYGTVFVREFVQDGSGNTTSGGGAGASGGAGGGTASGGVGGGSGGRGGAPGAGG